MLQHNRPSVRDLLRVVPTCVQLVPLLLPGARTERPGRTLRKQPGTYPSSTSPPHPIRLHSGPWRPARWAGLVMWSSGEHILMAETSRRVSPVRAHAKPSLHQRARNARGPIPFRPTLPFCFLVCTSFESVESVSHRVCCSQNSRVYYAMNMTITGTCEWGICSVLPPRIVRLRCLCGMWKLRCGPRAHQRA